MTVCPARACYDQRDQALLIEADGRKFKIGQDELPRGLNALWQRCYEAPRHGAVGQWVAIDLPELEFLGLE